MNEPQEKPKQQEEEEKRPDPGDDPDQHVIERTLPTKPKEQSDE